MTTDKSFYEKGTVDKVYVDYVNIVNVIKKGNRVYIDDGLMSLVVDEVGKEIEISPHSFKMEFYSKFWFYEQVLIT